MDLLDNLAFGVAMSFSPDLTLSFWV